MGVNLVFGLGFTSEYVLRIIANRGISNVDVVYLFSVWNEDSFRKKQSEDTMDTVIKFLNTAGVREVKSKYLDITRGFYNIVSQIASEVSGENLEIYLIGGMRILNLALYYFALLESQLGRKVKVISYSEDMAMKFDLPEKLPNVIKDSTIDILKIMRKREKIFNRDEINMEELSEELGKSLPTISRNIQYLEEEGFVECISKKPKICKLTELGRIIVEVYNNK